MSLYHKLRRLLDIMCTGDNVSLTERGKEYLKEYERDGFTVTWVIQALEVGDTVQICSSYHDIVGGVPIDCFDV